MAPSVNRLVAENRRWTVAPFKSATQSSQEKAEGNAAPEAAKSAAFPMIGFFLPLFAGKGTDI
jgi:hypothetical protein